MSDDLRKLIEAVEEGSWDGSWKWLIDHIWNIDHCAPFSDAYHGSLDAAIALCEVLLPGWNWGRMNDRMFVEQGDSVLSERDPNPARALLLAVLRAKLMETSHDPH